MIQELHQLFIGSSALAFRDIAGNRNCGSPKLVGQIIDFFFGEPPRVLVDVRH